MIGFLPMMLASLNILRAQLEQDAARRHHPPHRLGSFGGLVESRLKFPLSLRWGHDARTFGSLPGCLGALAPAG
jgi:hypothetical protein